MSINRVTISGNLGRDPELRATKSGMQVLSFSVCVNDRRKNRSGEWEDTPNWLDCVMFGQRAEGVSRYLAKGSHVTVAGKLRQRTWQTDDGQKRSKVEVVCEDIDFHGGKRSEQPAAENEQTTDVYDDDIPF